METRSQARDKREKVQQRKLQSLLMIKLSLCWSLNIIYIYSNLEDDSKLPKLKVVLVGDSAVGKSCLISNYIDNTFTENYEPTVLDVYTGRKTVTKGQVMVEVHDTSGDSNLATNRKVQYAGADIFMICIATDRKSSLDGISSWIQEIQATEASKPIFLVLTKSDSPNA